MGSFRKNNIKTDKSSIRKKNPLFKQKIWLFFQKINTTISNDFGWFWKNFMAKQEAEWSNRFSIFWLKKHGYLPKKDGWQSYGRIVWSYNGVEKSSIGFIVSSKNEDGGEFIRLQYTHTSNWTGEKSEMDFKIPLVTTRCNYGGERYWFLCPLSKNGVYCGRRVGVLFSVGKWYGCRHCGEIAYSSQMRGGEYRGSSVTFPDIDKAEQEVKRYYYRGKPTRKYRRVIRLNEKLEWSFTLMAASVDKRFGRLAGLKK